MKANADCYTGWVTGNTVVLLDTWSPDSVNQPKEDTQLTGQSNVMYVTGSESGGKTTISFTRLLNTGLYY